MHFESFSWLLPLAALLAAGLFAGYCAGMFGIGGGFVVVPALLLVLPLIGGDAKEWPHVAVGTSAATIIVASLRSVTAHAKRGAVDFGILRSWAPWLVLGDALGVVLASHVDGHEDAADLRRRRDGDVGDVHRAAARRATGSARRCPGRITRVAIAGGLGAFSSLLGIGGGTIAITVMTLCSRTIHKAIATASGIGVLIAIPTTIGFAIIGFNHPGLPWGSLGYINLPAAIAISSMSILTAPLGVAAAHGLPSTPLKRIFGAYLVVISLFMFRNALKL